MDTLLSDCPRHFSSAFVPNGDNQGAPYQPAQRTHPELGVRGPSRGSVGMEVVPG